MIAIAPDEVHVWGWRVSATRLQGGRAGRLLSGEELARADRFLYPEHRAAFLSAHIGLRIILAGYVGIAPSDLAFGETRRGKPCLVQRRGRSVEFNLAHSADLALLAVSSGAPVGVDVEKVRPISLDVAHANFAPAEVGCLLRLPAPERDESFLRCWTRKEAFVKATGDGLDTPLASFEVTLAPHEEARFHRIGSDPAESGRWQLAHLAPAAGYVGAVASRSRGWSVVWKKMP